MEKGVFTVFISNGLCLDEGFKRFRNINEKLPIYSAFGGLYNVFLAFTVSVLIRGAGGGGCGQGCVAAGRWTDG